MKLPCTCLDRNWVRAVLTLVRRRRVWPLRVFYHRGCTHARAALRGSSRRWRSNNSGRAGFQACELVLPIQRTYRRGDRRQVFPHRLQVPRPASKDSSRRNEDALPVLFRASDASPAQDGRVRGKFHHSLPSDRSGKVWLRESLSHSHVCESGRRTVQC